MQFRMTVVVLALVLTGVTGWADIGPSEEDLQGVAKSLQGVTVDKPARMYQTNDRYLRFISAPPEAAYTPSSPTKAASPEGTARAFLGEHSKAFGITSANTAFTRERVRTRGSDSYVRFQQTYGGVPVFGAQMNVQVSADGGVRSAISDIMRNTAALDSGRLSLTPTLTAAQAQARAVARTQVLHPGIELQAQPSPELNLYDPSVLEVTGPTRLVWIVVVESPADPNISRRLLVDAHTGDIALEYSLIHNALFRQIYDVRGTYSDIGSLRRQEGQGPTGDKEVDDVYDFLGDTYNFLMEEHGRDSYDGSGGRITASVGISMSNASWSPSLLHMSFGLGWTTDDIVAHELSHGFTQSCSDLIYYGQSGAINEAFSDIWGEFVDLTNGKGTDTDLVRWVIGEDLPIVNNTIPGGKGIRDMRTPGNARYTRYDRYWYYNDYPYLQRNNVPYPDNFNDFYDAMYHDNGGVHINSSIVNKLCYLITDGDAHKGFNVAPLSADQRASISLVADLFYEVQTNLITSGASFGDLAMLLIHAAYNLDYTLDQIRSIELAAKAVGIMPTEPSRAIRHLRASSRTGDSSVYLRWDPAVSNLGAELPATIVRREDKFPTDAADGVVIATGAADGHFSDDTALAGHEYFYGIFSDSNQGADFARVVAGAPQQDYLSETFSANGAKPFNLAYSQLTFDPLWDSTAAYASGHHDSYANFTNYSVTIKKDVYTLPVNSQGATYLAMPEDGYATFTPEAPIPFFGEWLTVGMFSANGYLGRLHDYDAFARETRSTAFNYPSLKSHFDWRKISFFFADLSPDSGGTVWWKYMPDRVVLTFERVPEFASARGNTVQLELFYSGRIRITILEVHAKNVIVGLSDGNGTPVNVATGKAAVSNLGGLPQQQTAITQTPVAPMWVQENQELRFTVAAQALSGTPAFEFGRVGSTGLLDPLPTGASVTPGGSTATSEFVWTPDITQAGYYTFRATFKEGNRAVSQDIQVQVGNLDIPPTLVEAPKLIPAEPQDSDTIRLVYQYQHVENFPEGAPTVYWYKNGIYVAGLVNQREIPSSLTKIGDVWRALVIPYTNNGIAGDQYFTNTVTVGADLNQDINKDGKIDALDLQLVINAALGMGQRSFHADVDYDNEVNARDIQLLINRILYGNR